MPRFLEDILKHAAAAKGFTGRQADRYTYGAMNNMGAMKGSRTTPRGAAMQAKHTADVKAGTASGMHPHRNLGRWLHPKKAR